MMKYWGIYENWPANAIVRLLQPWSRDSRGQETFLALSAGKESRNYDTKLLKPPYLPISTKFEGIEP